MMSFYQNVIIAIYCMGFCFDLNLWTCDLSYNKSQFADLRLNNQMENFSLLDYFSQNVVKLENIVNEYIMGTHPQYYSGDF